MTAAALLLQHCHCRSADPLDIQLLKPDEGYCKDLLFVLVTPTFEAPTREMRAALPAEVPFKSLIANSVAGASLVRLLPRHLAYLQPTSFGHRGTRLLRTQGPPSSQAHQPWSTSHRLGLPSCVRVATCRAAANVMLVVFALLLRPSDARAAVRRRRPFLRRTRHCWGGRWTPKWL